MIELLTAILVLIRILLHFLGWHSWIMGHPGDHCIICGKRKEAQ